MVDRREIETAEEGRITTFLPPPFPLPLSVLMNPGSSVSSFPSRRA